MPALEAELQLALAEVAWLTGESDSARQSMHGGLALVERCHVQQALRDLQLRQPRLLQAIGRAEPGH